MRLREYSPNWPDDLTYGIEFECFAPYDESRDVLYEVENLLNDNVLNVRLPRGSSRENASVTNYSNHDVSYFTWKVKTDSSLRLPWIGREKFSRVGVEIITPILKRPIYRTKVQDVLKILNEKGFGVNTTCGTHIHFGISSFFDMSMREYEPSLGIRELNSRQRVFHASNSLDRHTLQNAKYLSRILWLADAYQEFEACFDLLVSGFRRGNQNDYARSLRDIRPKDYYRREFNSFNEREEILQHAGRKSKLNLTTLITHGTVEVRHLEGTLDYELISSWAWLMGRFIHKAMESPLRKQDRSRRFDDLMMFLRSDRDMHGRDEETKKFVEYLRGRAHTTAMLRGETLKTWR